MRNNDCTAKAKREQKMKQTLSASEVAYQLKSDEYAGWSYNGAMALAEYLEEYEESTGEELELDVVAIRCDYSEYGSAVEAAEDYGWEKPDSSAVESRDEYEESCEDAALEWLQDRTTVVTFEDKYGLGNGSGVIVGEF